MKKKWKKRPRGSGKIIQLLIFLLLCISCSGDNGNPVDPGIPDNPRLIGKIETTCSEDVVRFGDILYVADGPGGLKVVDIGNPANPVLVREIQSKYAFRVYIHNNLLYLCDCSDGYRIFLITDPSDPFEIYSEKTEYATSMAFYNGRLYLGDYFGGLRTYSLADPSNPVLLDVNEGIRARDLFIHDNNLLATDSPFGLMTFHLGNPDKPAWTYSDASVMANYEDVVGYRNYALIARNDEASRLLIFDVSNTGNVWLVNEYFPSRFIDSLTLSGDNLTLTCGEDGVIIYDLSGMLSIRKLWAIDTPGYARRARLDNGYLYVADMNSLAIYEIPGMQGGVS